MTPTEFSQYKYQHTDPAVRSPARIGFTAISFAVALVLLASRSVPLPLALFALTVPAIAWYSAARHLLLGPRYLLCGKTIVYYANVKRITVSRGSGTLRLQSNSGKDFVLDRDKFPTGARKTDKIQKNKAAKFAKVTDKIVEKVRKAAPGAELIGG